MATNESLSSPVRDRVFASVADLLVRAAELHPTHGLHMIPAEPAHDAEFVTYPALLREAQHILGGLQTCAGELDSKVALLLERPRDFIPAFWACILGGYVPCPLAPIRSDPDRWDKHLAHVDALLEHPLVVSTGTLFHELPESTARVDLHKLRTGKLQENMHHGDASDPAILMLTSGSTGNSKAVELTHGNLLASMRGRAQRQQLTSADVAFNWIAFDHVAALLESHMIALFVGATQVHAQPVTVLTDPLQFLRLIHRHRVSLAFAPNFLLGQINAALQATSLHASDRRSFALDLSCLRRIVTGGEANVVETGRRFLDLLAPYGLASNALWPAFGMTETCAASVYSHEFPDCDADREFAAVGWPIAGLQIRIVNDEDGHACPVGGTGELQVSGAVIFHRYYHNEEATRAAFTSDGWFRTGDLGRVEDGRLRLVARNKDSIIVNGVNYFSHELETKLEQLAGIERSFVAAFPTRPQGVDTEQLVVTFATTVPEDDEETLYRLLVAVRNTTIMLWGFRPALILPLPKESFPKTSLGKIQRSLMRKRLEAGELDTRIEYVARLVRRQLGPYAAPETSLESEIVNVFAETLRVEQGAVSATSSFFDLGGTSLDILKLAQMLERRVGLKAGLPFVLRNPSARQIARHVGSGERHPSSQYDPIVALQTTGRKTPLFCVHPGNGEVFVLVNVAKYFLNDRPFYALRPRGFEAGEEPFRTFDEMVETYVDAILRRQPEGPYAIAGYSLGSNVAFEIAKVLEARGKEIGFLGSIDFGPRLYGAAPTFNMAAALALVIDLVTREQYEELCETLGAQLPSNEICERVLKVASAQRLQELNLDPHKFAVWARVAFANETMVLSHPTSGKVNSMTIFCSEGMSSRYTAVNWTRETWLRELKRWDDFVRQPKYVDIPGHHHALMGPKHVAAFQAALRTELDLSLGMR